jgi:hypothetical protein
MIATMREGWELVHRYQDHGAYIESVSHDDASE